MYEEFFGLRERPFELTANPRFLVLTAHHREAFEQSRLRNRRSQGTPHSQGSRMRRLRKASRAGARQHLFLRIREPERTGRP